MPRLPLKGVHPKAGGEEETIRVGNDARGWMEDGTQVFPRAG